jgi:hypothetical protein
VSATVRAPPARVVLGSLWVRAVVGVVVLTGFSLGEITVWQVILISAAGWVVGLFAGRSTAQEGRE